MSHPRSSSIDQSDENSRWSTFIRNFSSPTKSSSQFMERNKHQDAICWPHWNCFIRPFDRPPKTPWETCEPFFLQAIKSSQADTRHSVIKWMAAKHACDKNGIAFERAMNTNISTGLTPLRYLVKTRDHIALNFVHESLPPGDYHGNIHLGPYRKRKSHLPIKSWSLKNAESAFGYCGQFSNRGGVGGYGVLNWKNGTTYVGDWMSCMVFLINRPFSYAAVTLKDAEGKYMQFWYGRTWDDVIMDPMRLDHPCDVDPPWA